jgi:hypothetical protein
MSNVQDISAIHKTKQTQEKDAQQDEQRRGLDRRFSKSEKRLRRRTRTKGKKKTGEGRSG